jgi:hypothetical protein
VEGGEIVIAATGGLMKLRLEKNMGAGEILNASGIAGGR